MASEDSLAIIKDGWTNHQSLVVRALQDLTPDQLGLRAAPNQWAVWQLAAHMAGVRAYYFYDWMGEGEPSVRDLFKVERTTVPDLSLEDAGWEDDETNPRDASELVAGLSATWRIIDDCLRRWTSEDLWVDFTKQRSSGARTLSRGRLIWHVMEHDIHHAGEISQILGSNGLPPLDM